MIETRLVLLLKFLMLVLICKGRRTWEISLTLYRVIQEERSIFWEMIVSVIVRQKVYMTKCLILNGYRIRTFEVTNSKNILNRNKKEKLRNINLL